MAEFTPEQQTALQEADAAIAARSSFTLEQQEALREADAAISAIPDDSTLKTNLPQAAPFQPAEPTKGPIGLVSPQVRETVRSGVKKTPGFFQLLTEMAPAGIGAARGAALGAPGGPLGMIAGGVIGGVTGELLAQESGVAPRSNLNIGLTATGPFVGPGAGLVKKVIGKGAALTTKLPFASAARGQAALRGSGEATESIGASIFARQKGLAAESANTLYEKVREAGVFVRPEQLTRTIQAMTDLLGNLNDFRAVPQVRSAIRVISRQKNLLTKRPTFSQVPGKGISLDNIVAARQDIGREIRAAARAGGPKKGATKKLFAAIAQDMDDIAEAASRVGEGGKLAKAAIDRAKLEFAVTKLESKIAQLSKDTVDKAGELVTEVNISSFSKFLKDVSNPKSKQFDKNFVDAIGAEEIVELRENAARLAEIMKFQSAGGAGSLVARGAAAAGIRSLTGAVLGFSATHGLIGTLAGVIGANAPEAVVALLSNPRALRVLEAASKAGKGPIDHRTLVLVGTLLTRSAGLQTESSAELPGGIGGPSEEGIQGVGG